MNDTQQSWSRGLVKDLQRKDLQLGEGPTSTTTKECQLPFTAAVSASLERLGHRGGLFRSRAGAIALMLRVGGLLYITMRVMFISWRDEVLLLSGQPPSLVCIPRWPWNFVI